MRFISFLTSPTTGMPPEGLYPAIAALGKEAGDAGVLIETGAPVPGPAVALSLANGAIDRGTYEPTSEDACAFAIYEGDSVEDVLPWVERFLDCHRAHWPEWTGRAEVRQLF